MVRKREVQAAQSWADLPPPSQHHPMSGGPIWNEASVRAVLARVGAVREQALEEAADVCDVRRSMLADRKSVRTALEASNCADAIRALKGTPAAAVADHVGESDFEQWFASYQPQGKGAKQQARDAYAAGMAGQLSGNAGEVDAKDADRYRALVDLEWYVGPADFYCSEGGILYGKDDKNLSGKKENLDTAVDAAIAASKGANHG